MQREYGGSKPGSEPPLSIKTEVPTPTSTMEARSPSGNGHDASCGRVCGAALTRCIQPNEINKPTNIALPHHHLPRWVPPFQVRENSSVSLGPSTIWSKHR